MAQGHIPKRDNLLKVWGSQLPIFQHLFMRPSMRETLGHRYDIRAQQLREWAACVREHRAADPETEGLRPVRVKLIPGGWVTIWDDAPPPPEATAVG